MKVWKVILAALVIFAAGIVSGALGIHLKHASRPERPNAVSERPPVRWWVQQQRAFLNRLDHHLDLTAPQRERIRGILQGSQARMKDLWDSIAPQAHDEFMRVRQEILAELNPEQREKYHETFRARGPHKPGKGFERWKSNRGPRNRPTIKTPPSSQEGEASVEDDHR